MGLDSRSRSRFNLSKSAILVLETSTLGMAITSQILMGFGAKRIYRCATVTEATEAVNTFEIDLMIVDGVAETGEGYEFVRWVRHHAAEPNKFAPILLTMGHTMASDVAKSRDCGGHFLITKPLAPIVLLERIIWAAKAGRGFLFSDSYVGPDRRFHDCERPGGLPGRRRGDAETSAAISAPPTETVDS
jgi:DNA-binding response OmpR family regulator